MRPGKLDDHPAVDKLQTKGVLSTDAPGRRHHRRRTLAAERSDPAREFNPDPVGHTVEERQRRRTSRSSVELAGSPVGGQRSGASNLVGGTRPRLSPPPGAKAPRGRGQAPTRVHGQAPVSRSPSRGNGDGGAGRTYVSNAVPPATLTIVVPLYRDAENVEALFDRLSPVIASLDLETELVLVDDGSFDGTFERTQALGVRTPFPTTVVRLARNFGQHAAVLAGMQEARGDALVTLDSDLQYPPEEIPRLLAELSPAYPVVSGYRADRSDPWHRRVITRILSGWLGRRTGSPLKDYGSMFRAYDRRVVDQLLQFTERRRYIPGLVGWLGVPVKEIPVRHDARGRPGLSLSARRTRQHVP